VARRGKFGRLVDQFVTTVEQMGGVVDSQVVAEELQTRIDMVAGQLRIKPETVLRNHIPDDWGQVAASAMMTEIQQRQMPTGPAEHLAVRVATRLQAALGQVLIYAAANGDQQQDVPALDLHHLGEAVSGLALAITETPPGTEYVVIGADIADWTRTALETLRDQLRAGAWTHCPCGERHGQEEIDMKVLRAVSADLLFLPPAPQPG
jgi:hypothetical protein